MTNTNNYRLGALLIGVFALVGCEYDDMDTPQLDPAGTEQIAVLSALDHIAGLPQNTGTLATAATHMKSREWPSSPMPARKV